MRYYPTPSLSSHLGGMTVVGWCICIPVYWLCAKSITAQGGISEFCKLPWRVSHHQVLSELRLAALACCLLQPLPQGNSLRSRAGHQQDKLVQLVVSANLSVWFGSLSQPPSESPFSGLRDSLSPSSLPLAPKVQWKIRFLSGQCHEWKCPFFPTSFCQEESYCSTMVASVWGSLEVVFSKLRWPGMEITVNS